MRKRHLLTAAAWLAMAACSIDSSLFSEGEAIGGGSGGNTSSSSSSTDASSSSSQQSSSSSSSGPSSSSTSSSTNTGVGGASVGGAGSVGGGGVGGGSTGCAHKPCEAGAALAAGCDPCVTSICNDDPFCCNQEWDDLCTYLVDEICGDDCNPTLPTCEDQYDALDGVFDVCGQNGEVCEVAFGNGGTCNGVCGRSGTQCITVYNNAQGTICQRSQQGQFSCDQPANSAICLCTRGCGSGPPCPGDQICLGGMCTNN
jgi:hypothetical protein